MKSFLVIFNNKSGKKEAYSYKKQIYKKLSVAGIKFKFVFIDVLPFLGSLEKYDSIIVVGGDGSICSVLPYLIGTEKKLGIVPIGTANLLAAKLGISLSVDKALDVILEGKTKKIDVGKINDKPFILRLGFGYDADIINKTPQWLKRKLGYLAYFIFGIKSLCSLKTKRYRLKTDNKLFITASCIIIANSSNMFRNLFSVSDNSFLDDGMFDLFVVRSDNPFIFIYEFFKILLNIKVCTKNILYKKVSQINIKTKENSIHIDGERYEKGDNLKIVIIPHSIDVYCK